MSTESSESAPETVNVIELIDNSAVINNAKAAREFARSVHEQAAQTPGSEAAFAAESFAKALAEIDAGIAQLGNHIVRTGKSL